MQASAMGEDYGSIGFHAVKGEGYDISPDTTAQGVPAVGLGGKADDKEGNSIAHRLSTRRQGHQRDVPRRMGVLRYLNKDSDLDGQAYNDPIPWPDL
jgi:hypothetical protein